MVDGFYRQGNAFVVGQHKQHVAARRIVVHERGQNMGVDVGDRELGVVLRIFTNHHQIVLDGRADNRERFGRERFARGLERKQTKRASNVVEDQSLNHASSSTGGCMNISELSLMKLSTIATDLFFTRRYSCALTAPYMRSYTD